MIALWDHFWEVFTVGLAIGLLTGWLMRRPIPMPSQNRLMGDRDPVRGSRRRRKLYVLAGGLASVLSAILWAGPLGAGDRLALEIERSARATLEHYEMRLVTARVERSPLRRRLLLSGPADDFQQGELVRMMNEIPGVGSVRWTNPPGQPVEPVE